MALSDLYSNVQILLRWLHVLAGVIWIGHLYFFNFVNVPFQGKIGADVKIGREPAVSRLFEPKAMVGVARHPIVDIGAEAQQRSALVRVLDHFDSQKRRIVDLDADLLDRRHQEVFVALALQNGREQPHQGGTTDRRAEIEPGSVRSDAHVEIAAERRIPQMYGRQALALGGARQRLIENVAPMGEPLNAVVEPGAALQIANDTVYGLGAGVWSRDGNRGYRMGRAIKAGRVWTNCYHAYPAHAAFGGYKQSGIGRETHKMMLDHYQQTKNLLVSYDEHALGLF